MLVASWRVFRIGVANSANFIELYEKNRDKFWVEMATRFRLDELQHCVLGPWLFVRASLAECVKDIGQADDTGEEGNLLATSAALDTILDDPGITSAIPFFVMKPSNFASSIVAIVVITMKICKIFAADVGMFLDLFEFC